jgi:hypothetical protein
MGDISKKLYARLSSLSGKRPTRGPMSRKGEPRPMSDKDIEKLIKDGIDPLHAAYASIQHSSADFAERVCKYPEMRSFVTLAGVAEDEYMPSFPPMSPLTSSYFTCWQLYDLRCGKDGETIGNCQRECNDFVRLTPDQSGVLKNLCDSRMGIYEHVGFNGDLVRLQELITGDEFSCLCTSGYRGTPKELWYVRRLPPLNPDQSATHLLFSTPYILIGSTKDDWIQFLKRTMVKATGQTERRRLHQLLKYGLGANYWHEFIFLAYHHYQGRAIFLAGIPDLKATLPHAN